MDIVKKILYFSVGIIMTVGFIVIGMSMYNKSKDTISSANAQYDGIIGRYADIEYALYEGEGTTASGTEVRDLICRLKDDSITIYVKNGSYLKNPSNDEAGVAYNCSKDGRCGYGNTYSITYETAKQNMTDRSQSMFYINPNAIFLAGVERDENGMISALSFTQK